jgi:hypothetical protein
MNDRAGNAALSAAASASISRSVTSSACPQRVPSVTILRTITRNDAVQLTQRSGDGRQSRLNRSSASWNSESSTMLAPTLESDPRQHVARSRAINQHEPIATVAADTADSTRARARATAAPAATRSAVAASAADR